MSRLAIAVGLSKRHARNETLLVHWIHVQAEDDTQKVQRQSERIILRQHSIYDLAMYIRQTEAAALVLERKTFVLDT